ncbi:hypothetical protein D6764_02770 [Candidatus Woesearchaeota archaeon]|nr:MAG: hypothetical protein D6764_02770 [Candidatus Woesearchaeota archaeon]
MIENKGFLKIKEKLLKEAEDRASAILAKAEEEAKQYEEKKQKEADEIIKAGEEKIELEKQLLRDRMLAQARLEAKTKYLNTREEIIDSIIEKALSGIKRDSKYQKFMKAVLSSNKGVLKQPLKLLVNKKDAELARKLLTSLKIKGTVSEAPITAGIMVEDAEGKRIDESFQARLERMRDDIRIRVAKLLENE